MRKIISIATVFCFMLSNVSFAIDLPKCGTPEIVTTLGASYLTDDMINNAGELAEMHLQMYLRLIDSPEITDLSAESLKELLLKTARTYRESGHAGKIPHSLIVIKDRGNEIILFPYKMEPLSGEGRAFSIPAAVIMGGTRHNVTLAFSTLKVKDQGHSVFMVRVCKTREELEAFKQEAGRVSRRHDILTGKRQVDYDVWINEAGKTAVGRKPEGPGWKPLTNALQLLNRREERTTTSAKSLERKRAGEGSDSHSSYRQLKLSINPNNAALVSITDEAIHDLIIDEAIEKHFGRKVTNKPRRVGDEDSYLKKYLKSSPHLSSLLQIYESLVNGDTNYNAISANQSISHLPTITILNTGREPIFRLNDGTEVWGHASDRGVCIADTGDARQNAVLIFFELMRFMAIDNELVKAWWNALFPWWNSSYRGRTRTFKEVTPNLRLYSNTTVGHLSLLESLEEQSERFAEEKDGTRYLRPGDLLSRLGAHHARIVKRQFAFALKPDKAYLGENVEVRVTRSAGGHTRIFIGSMDGIVAFGARNVVGFVDALNENEELKIIAPGINATWINEAAGLIVVLNIGEQRVGSFDFRKSATAIIEGQIEKTLKTARQKARKTKRALLRSLKSDMHKMSVDALRDETARALQEGDFEKVAVILSTLYSRMGRHIDQWPFFAEYTREKRDAVDTIDAKFHTVIDAIRTAPEGAAFTHSNPYMALPHDMRSNLEHSYGFHLIKITRPRFGSEHPTAAGPVNLSDLAPHPLVNAMLEMILENKRLNRILERGRFVERQKLTEGANDKREIFWFGYNLQHNASLRDIFYILCDDHTRSEGRYHATSADAIAVAKEMVEIANRRIRETNERMAGIVARYRDTKPSEKPEDATGSTIIAAIQKLSDSKRPQLIIEEGKEEEFVRELEMRLSRQVEHFSRQTGNMYIMRKYKPKSKGSAEEPLLRPLSKGETTATKGPEWNIIYHPMLEREVQKQVAERVFNSLTQKENTDLLLAWASSQKTIPVDVTVSFYVDNSLILKEIKGEMDYNTFAQKAHDIAQEHYPVEREIEAGIAETTEDEISFEGSEVPTAASRKPIRREDDIDAIRRILRVGHRPATRIINVLKRGGINTIGDLLDYDAVYLRRLIGMGKKSFADLGRAIAKIENQMPRDEIPATNKELTRSQQALQILRECGYSENGMSRKTLRDAFQAFDFYEITRIDENTGLIFSNMATFKNGLGVFLKEIAESGIKIAVIAKTPEQEALIGDLNYEIKKGGSDKKIECAASPMEATGKLNASNYYYFRVEEDDDNDDLPEKGNFVIVDITHLVEQILKALGMAAGVPIEKLSDMERARQKFIEAAA